jgi:hypothetical protein
MEKEVVEGSVSTVDTIIHGPCTFNLLDPGFFEDGSIHTFIGEFSIK